MRNRILSPILLIAAVAAFAYGATSSAQTSSSPQSIVEAPASQGHGAAEAPVVAPAVRAGVAANYGKLPISFEANRGQSDARVKFLARGSGYGLYLTSREAVLAFHAPTPEEARGRSRDMGKQAIKPKKTATDVVRMQLRGANASVNSVGVDSLPGTANYFIGNDPSKWQTNIPTYSKVKFESVYPGVDLVYYGNQSQLEYDFVVAPNADPKTIRLHFAGATKLALNANGDLSISARHGRISFHKPVIYQKANGQREPIQGQFILLARNEVGFTLANYNRSRPLVIDPVLAYSTYLGGSVVTGAYSIAVDSSGDAFVTGYTQSSNFPVTSGAVETVYDGDQEGFVAKLNPSGTALSYATYLGVADPTALSFVTPISIAVDSSGGAYITGYTNAIPTTAGAFQTKLPNEVSGFVTKLNATGTALIYSTYLGGSNGPEDVGECVTVDEQANAYVVGQAFSTDFPVTTGAFQSKNKNKYDSSNGFLTKLNATGTGLIYSTYLGGSGSTYNAGHGIIIHNGDGAAGIVVDGSGDAYVTGATGSPDFPVTSDAFQATNNDPYGSAFVTKMNPNGTALIYSTFLGGSGEEAFPFGDGASALALDASGDAYIAGTAFSANFPVTEGAYQTTNKNQYFAGNGFITALNSSGSALVYSTYLGGSGVDDGGSYEGDFVHAIALDSAGNAYVAGSAFSYDFPVTAGALQSKNANLYNSGNAFFTKLNASGSSLLYSTYLGGSGTYPYYGDYGNGIALDSSGNAYLAGQTNSNNFPVATGAFQRSLNGGEDAAFVAKINPEAGGPSGTAPAPAFLPVSGSKFVGSTTVELSDQDTNAIIYYTLGYGKPPIEWPIYEGPITISGFTHIQAYAVDTANYTNPSAVTMADYTDIGQTPAPVISPASGSYPTGQLITITDADPTATIRYTTDGSTPTTHSSYYDKPIVLSGAETIKAIAISTGVAPSDVTSVSFTVN